MNLLVLGKGQGSWQMRGVQLGTALGARVTSAPTDQDWHWAECVILVKHAGLRHASHARARGIPIVWDALDCWRQPGENALSEAASRATLHCLLNAIRPTLTIGATSAMAAACGGASLPHHGRLGLVPTPARETFTTIGYDGNPAYLAEWQPALQDLCTARGWTFVVNPPNLADVDLLVALRGGVWDGWMCREWKSGVKLVNAMLAGRPVITQPTAAWRDLQPMGSVVETLADLPDAIDQWVNWDRRREVVTRASLAASYLTLPHRAVQYQSLLAWVGSVKGAA